MTTAGIDKLTFYVPHHYIDMTMLARQRDVDPAKYLDGIGQEKMSVPAVDEDIVSMGASAGHQLLQNEDKSSIDMVLLATESGIDQSKAAAIYIHELLGLPATCLTVEMKQACSSGTAALLLALDHVRARPDKKVMVVATDIARYGLSTPGEPTQGAGAVAMLISANPRTLEISPEYVTYTEDVMDFWRPNDREEAIVDGQYSIKVYIRALTECWKRYSETTGCTVKSFDRFCYHMPFTHMARKAHTHLNKRLKTDCEPQEIEEQIAASLKYNRIIGNTYTGSLYIALASLLDNEHPAAGTKIGMFSYGSGCMAALFSGTVANECSSITKTLGHHTMLNEREPISYGEYVDLYGRRSIASSSDIVWPHQTTAPFRWAGIQHAGRIYEQNTADQKTGTLRQTGVPHAGTPC